MTSNGFASQYRKPEWQKRRLEMLEASGWECQECGEKSRELHVHHKRYRKGAKVWEYADHELMVLCDKCHKEWHRQEEMLKEAICHMSGCDIAQLRAYAQAMAAQCHSEPRFIIPIESYEEAEGVADFTHKSTRQILGELHSTGLNAITSTQAREIEESYRGYRLYMEDLATAPMTVSKYRAWRKRIREAGGAA